MIIASNNIDKMQRFIYTNNEVKKMSFKELFTQAKQKIYRTIEEGNRELKKYSASTRMTIYSKPILGGFITKQIFLEENSLLVLSTDFKDGDLQIHSIVKVDGNDDFLVVEKIAEEEEIKTLRIDGKSYSYPCHKIFCRSLNDVFTEETMGYSYRELTEVQQNTIMEIRKELEKRSFAVKEKKEACFSLWQYFTECISYQMFDHYIMHTFVLIAKDYVADFSNRLLKLFV